MDNTFIKLSRKIQSWRWYQDANTMRVFIHILLNANVYDHDFENITVKRGQWVTSQKRIAEQLNLSLKNVRTALDHLKATGEVAVKTTSKYSIITVFNYNQYQKVAHDSAVNRQSIGNQSVRTVPPHSTTVKPVRAGAVRVCGGSSTKESDPRHAMNTRSSVSGAGSMCKAAASV